MESIEERPLDDGLNDDYFDEDDVEDEYNEGWFAGYKAAQKEIREKLDSDE